MSAPKFRMRGTTTASEREATQKKTSTAPKFRMRGAGGGASPSLPTVSSQVAGETAGRKKAGKNTITGKINSSAKSQRKVAEEKTKPDTLLNILMRDTGHISEVVDSTTGQVISTPEASRGGSMLKGAAQGTAAGFTSTGGTFLDLLRSYDTAGSSYTRQANQEEENAAHYREMLERGTLDDGTPITASMRKQLETLAARAEQRSGVYRQGAEAQHAPISRAINSAYETADRLSEQSAENIAAAKEGLGGLGQFAVDVGVAGTQLAGDALLAALTGGSALVPMAVRGFGSGTQQARKEGATLGQQLAYGAGSAALSVATEQISNIGLFRRAFGAGVADNLAGKLVSRFGENTAVQVMNRLAQTPAGRVVASALGEGGEEAVEALVQPVLQRITYDDAALQQYQDPNYRADVIYQTLVGGTLGGLGGAVNIANRRATDATGAAQTETAPVSTTPAPETIQSVTRAAQASDPLLQALFGGRRVEQSTLTDDQFATLADRGDVGMDAGGRVYQVDPEQHIDRRGADAISDRRVNAFQYDHPELQPYYRQAAETLLRELNGSVRGGQTETATGEYGQTYSWRTRRNATDRISGLLDGGMSYARIESALDAIIHDKGRENNADAKRVEAVLDDMLSNGYRGDTGFVTSNQDYINAKNAIAGAFPAEQRERTIPEELMDEGMISNVNSADAANSVGAAAAGFTGDTERGFSRNVSTDQNMDPEIRESFQEDPETYFRLGNKKTLAKAQEIFDAGFESARSTLEQAIGQAQAGRKLPPEMVPLSRMVANQLARNGDVYGARKILSDISVELTEAGQLGQAAAILRGTDAATKVQTIEGLVKRMNEKFGSPKQQITVNDALIQKYTEARTDSERDAALDDIYQNIADQVPSTLVDKFNALRYLNMLGNLKTQVRNVGGNTVMMGVRFARGKVQAMMEAAVSKATGGKIQRTTTFLRDKNLYQEAKRDFENIQAEAMGQRRYSDYMSAAPSAIQDRRAIFKNSGTWGTKENSPAIARSVRQFTDILWKPLEGYRRLTNEAMERGDVFFSRRAYADALSRFLKANGVTAEQFRSGSVDPDLLERARTHAIQEAQEATFRDDNAFSDMVSSIGFKNANTAPKKAANLAVQGLLPFKRTPANVAVRAYEYSPAGIITTAVQAAQKAKGNENVTGADIIDSLSKTLTGTGIFALGMALFSRGMLTAGPDDDERQAAFDELTGKQDYALILPKGIAEQVGLPEGINFTLDWMSPAAMPLFMGAEFMKAAEDGGISFSDALSAVSSMSDVMLDMSMLQGINDQLSNVSYAEDPLVDLVLNTLTDYLTQGLTSTLAGQSERTFEPERMSTYTQEGQQLPTDFQYELGSASSRIPGWDYQQIPYIDAWGRTEETGDFFERLVNNTLNPSYISQIDLDAVEQELQRVYDATGESVFPSRADKTITSGGREKNLTAEEYTRYAKDLGQTRYRYAQDAMRSSAYRSMSSGDKAKFIGKMYEVANAQAKKNAWSAYQYDSEMESYAEAEAAGISATEFYVAKNTLNNIESDKDKNGESINGTRKPKVIDAINEMDLTPKEKDWLFLREYDSDSAKREVRRLPWN